MSFRSHDNVNVINISRHTIVLPYSNLYYDCVVAPNPNGYIEYMFDSNSANYISITVGGWWL